MVELEAFRAVEGDQRHTGLAVERVGVADQRRSVQEVGKLFSGFRAFRDGAHEFFQIFDAGNVVRSVAVLQHLHVASVVQNGAQEVRGALLGQIFLELGNQFLEGAQRRNGAASGSTRDKLCDCLP